MNHKMYFLFITQEEKPQWSEVSEYLPVHVSERDSSASEDWLNNNLSLIGLREGFLDAYTRQPYRVLSTFLFHWRFAVDVCGKKNNNNNNLKSKMEKCLILESKINRIESKLEKQHASKNDIQQLIKFKYQYNTSTLQRYCSPLVVGVK